MTTKPRKILIMEDEHPLATALELKLTSEGFEVDIAYDGESGMKKLLEKSYDLILLDLIMPLKDGFKVLEEMKEANIKVPVIALTNLSQREDLDRVKDYGVDKYLVKSDTPLHEVVDNIKKFLGDK